MNILGIGPAELVIVFLLMLMVAGPKRMIAWAYVAGQYAARLRKMWQEASAVIRKELEQAGVEPEVMDSVEEWINPRTRPQARKNLLDPVVKEMKKPMDDVFKPISDTMKDVGRTQLDPASPAEKEKPASGQKAEASPAGSDGTNSSGSSAEQASSGGFDAWTPN